MKKGVVVEIVTMLTACERMREMRRAGSLGLMNTLTFVVVDTTGPLAVDGSSNRKHTPVSGNYRRCNNQTAKERHYAEP